MGRSIRQKISKATEDLNNTVDRLDLTDIDNTPPNKSRINILLKHT